MRQDQLVYRVYHVDTLSKGNRYDTQEVIENEDGGFRTVSFLGGETFQTLEALISSKITQGKAMTQLVPGDRDRTGLQLCRNTPLEVAADDGEPDAELIDLKKFKAIKPLRSTPQQQNVVMVSSS